MQSFEKLEFIKRHKLPQSYLDEASVWFTPLVEACIAHHNSAKKPLVLGINGCQGSGKTTLSDYLVTSFRQSGLTSVAISIDDFYLDHVQREKLANHIHPLLATRGVPGTHDLDLAHNTLRSLKEPGKKVPIPRFDKATDNKTDRCNWISLEAPIDIIILEGWCVGIPPQDESSLEPAANELESKDDQDGVWRRYVNDQLKNTYLSLWQALDLLIMLKAPSFDCVYRWRLEQEEKLLSKYKEDGNTSESRIMSPAEIARFVQHYERLTRHALNELPKYCQHVYELDDNRQICAHQHTDQPESP